MENAKEVIESVKGTVSQHYASRKDEVTVMKAIINDPNYSVDIYEKGGNIEEYFPAKVMTGSPLSSLCILKP